MQWRCIGSQCLFATKPLSLSRVLACRGELALSVPALVLSSCVELCYTSLAFFIDHVPDERLDCLEMIAR